ncbi:MAG: hypothetical protein HW416_3351 [Chloroflexi bacterium]|nr:hypothetical protein [Chloroflexota bacterium]
MSVRNQSRHLLVIGPVALFSVLAACAQAGPTPSPGDAERLTDRAASARTTMVLLAPIETSTLSRLQLFPGGGTAELLVLFNAGLTMADADGGNRPYLAEQIPQLNTESWTLGPDGKMETVFRLRANATWHDGTPLRASDFVFTWQVVSSPDLGLAGVPPQRLMEEVSALDDRTLRIRWSQPNPDVGRLDAGSRGLMFPPLPRHLLEAAYQQGPDALRNHPFWTVDYVGVGPYRLDRWESGAFVEARAFEGHVLGRPKIERIKVLFVPDSSAVLAHLLAGEAHSPIDTALDLAQGLVLRDRWGDQGPGRVVFQAGTLRWTDVQHRPEYANPGAVLDVRVRRALALAIDKPAMNEGLFASMGEPSHGFVRPTKPYFPAIEAAITRYPFDLRRSEQLMNEAGFTKDRDGSYTQPGGGPMSFELITNQGAESERERSILAAGWRQAGFQIEEGVRRRGTDAEARSTYPSMSITAGFSGIDTVTRFTSATIPRAANRWTGENTGGWSNADYDRAAAAVQSALDRDVRIQHLAETARAMSEDLGAIVLHYSPKVYAFPTNLSGVKMPDPDEYVTWNIFEWELR